MLCTRSFSEKEVGEEKEEEGEGRETGRSFAYKETCALLWAGCSQCIGIPFLYSRWDFFWQGRGRASPIFGTCQNGHRVKGGPCLFTLASSPWLPILLWKNPNILNAAHKTLRDLALPCLSAIHSLSEALLSPFCFSNQQSFICIDVLIVQIWCKCCCHLNVCVLKLICGNWMTPVIIQY